MNHISAAMFAVTFGFKRWENVNLFIHSQVTPTKQDSREILINKVCKNTAKVCVGRCRCLDGLHM